MDEFDLRELSDAPVADVPWYFRLGRYLSKRKIRGGDRLLAGVRRLGLLDRLAVYSLGGVMLHVPLWRPCNQWLEDDVQNYEAAFIRALGAAVSQLSGDVTLIDCGADIGTVSAHLVSRCRNIKRVVAFEPNAAAFGVLKRNLHAMAIATEARHAAVGDFAGRGELTQASQDPSAHAMYIVPSATGSIAVQRVDDLPHACPGGAHVIKIDVEGTEAAVVRGASDTIRRAGEVIVAFEAHPRVAQREQRDPIEVIEALLAIRRFAFTIDTTPARSIRADRPIFEQLAPTRVYNVIAHSQTS